MNNNKKLFAIHIGEVIVNECLKRNLDINTSKLMKLLYYMQRLHIQKYEDTMFNDEIRVTANGPYIDGVANYFWTGRLGFDNRLNQSIILKDSHEDVANLILNRYGKFSPNDLLKLSLEDELFKIVWADGTGNNRIIPFHLESKKEKSMSLCKKR